MSYKILGRLPDPFIKADGTRMSADEWYAKRDEIFRDRNRQDSPAFVRTGHIDFKNSLTFGYDTVECVD